MTLGTLRLRFPTGQTHEYSLEQPSVGLGRADDNELVIDHASLSRRHARLTVEGGRLLVEDLGSANGTYLGNQRLAPHTPTLLPERQTLRFGDVEARFVPAEPAQPAAFGALPAGGAPLGHAAPLAPVAPPVEVSLTGPAEPVAPGSAVTATIFVQNAGNLVDELTVRVTGTPAEWVRLSQDRLSLLPGAQEQVTLTFQPPRHADTVAADHRFAVTVASREHRVTASASGVLQVLPFQGFGLNLQPVRSRGRFTLVATNQGNAPVAYQLAAEADDEALLFQFGQAAITLEPGQRANVLLHVSPKAPPQVGPRETRAFTVVATGAEGPQPGEARVAGELIVQPPIPIWLIPVVILLGLAACIGVLAGYWLLCPAYFPTGPGCRAAITPTINVFSISPEQVRAGDSVIVTWDVSNAQTVELVAPVRMALGATGTEVFTINGNTVLTLVAANAAGSVEATRAVHVEGFPPVVERFTVDPAVIVPGQAPTLTFTWVVKGATEVSIEGVPGQHVSVAGRVQAPAPDADTVYTLVATNAAGPTRQPVRVVVSSAGCAVARVPASQVLFLRTGPSSLESPIVALTNGTSLDPLARTGAGDWLRVLALGRDGWVPAANIVCTSAPDFMTYPTVVP